MKYTMGLDIGIASVGWAVLENDSKGVPKRIVDLGVRCFETAEIPKTGATLASKRREARGMRRRLRRRKHRLGRVKNLLKDYGISLKDIEFEKEDVYKIRVDALETKLEPRQWTRVLLLLTKRRGFKSNRRGDKSADEGELLTATKENQELAVKYRSIGDMLYNDPKFIQDGLFVPRNKGGEYKNTVLRAELEKEIRLLFLKQREFGNSYATEEIEEKYLEIFNSQRSFDEGPGGHSPYGGDLINKMRGPCTFEREEKRAPQAAYTFEYFRLLQEINNLRIYQNGKDRSLSSEERALIVAEASKRKELKYSDVRKMLRMDEDASFNRIHGNEKETKRFASMAGSYQLKKILGEGTSCDLLDAVAEKLSICKSEKKASEELRKLNVSDDNIEKLLGMSFSKFGHLSILALKNITPYLEKGMTYDKACVAAGYTNDSGERSRLLNPQKFLNDINSPVVRRAVSQTIKVVNAIIRKYGSPQYINVELAREMSKSHAERNKIKKQQNDNQHNNARIKEKIREIGVLFPKGQDIVKYKLWEDQQGVCLYSGNAISVNRIFENGYAEVDHIIPYSRSLDDGYNNKVLVLASENQKKGGRIPFEYFGDNADRWEDFGRRVAELVKDKSKRNNFLRKEFTPADAEDWKKRNLNDTKYISRFVCNMLKDNLEFAEIDGKRHVMAVNGAITSKLRGRWGLNKNRDVGDKHHAQDAVVIAATTQSLINKVTKHARRTELVPSPNGFIDLSTGEIITVEEYETIMAERFPKPWDDFTKEVELRLSNNPNMDELMKCGYSSDDMVKPIFVSRMPKHKSSGQAHEDTIRSKRGGEGFKTSKKDISSLKLVNGEIKGYYRSEQDPLLYNALKAWLALDKADRPIPFRKPLKNGQPGPIVKKVWIMEKTTLSVDVNGGIADNGGMLRADIFRKENKYYVVPIYVSDMVKGELPNKAISREKSGWREMDETYEFQFSLYSRDLIRIKNENGVELSGKVGAVVEKDFFAYYIGTGISTGSFEIINHDNALRQPSVGVQNLDLIEKYTVDPLGNYHRVGREERLGFKMS